MKRIFVALMMMLALVTVNGCGGGDDGPTVVTTDILSDETVDGYIRELFPSLDLQVVQGGPSVFAGVDRVTLDEFRGFLHFPLGDIPLNARISNATLDIFVRNVTAPFGGSVPLRLELVALPTATPFTGNEFDDPPLSNTVVVFPVFNPGDISQHVLVDVTPLVAVAQARGDDVQLRISQDVVGARGVVEIDDTASATAPLLSVSWF